MKSLLLFYLLIFLTIQFLVSEHAAAAAFTMGQLQTVSSDGSLDVIRNPSLMTAQKTDNSVGIILLSTPFTSNRFSYDFFQVPWISTGRARDTKFITGSMFLSYCRKIQNGVIGLALDTDNQYQGVYTRYERTNTGILTGHFIRTVISGKSTIMTPRFVLSYGTTVSGNHSVGIQCAAGYMLFRDDTGYQSVVDYFPYQKNHARKKTEEARAELSFGYSYRDADSQAGLMIRSGRFSWRKTKIYYSHGDFITPLMFAGSASEPFNFQYERGFTLIGGGYHKLASFIAIALEGEYEIPVTYAWKDLRYDEMTGFYAVTNNLAVDKSGLYCLRAGFEILPSGPVTINLGGGMSTTRESRRGKFFSEFINTDTFTGTFGIDFKFVENLMIMAGSQLIYTKERKRGKSNYIVIGTISYIGASSYDGPATLLNINVFSGMSCGF
jgi:hypothetical protein